MTKRFQNLKQTTLEKIRSVQQSNGSFLSFSSPDKENFIHSKTYHTIFGTALPLLVLSTLTPSDEVNNIQQEAARFLLTQKSNVWSFNYWIRESEEAKKFPYPDDLDDTFVSLAALYRYDKQLFTGDVFSHVVNILTSCEKEAGGPYKTWIATSAQQWQDYDLVVNANILSFLKLFAISLPQCEHFLQKKIVNNAITSTYYPSPASCIYFLLRSGISLNQEYLISRLLQEKQGPHWENPLETALCVSSLLRLNYDLKKLAPAIEYLYATHESQWTAYGLYKDPEIAGISYFSGSPVLTSLFCLEALEVYDKRLSVSDAKTVSKPSYTDLLYTAISRRIQQRLSRYKEHSSYRIQAIIDTLPDQQIPLLPYYFTKALGENEPVSDKLLIQLGTATAFGWIAYTIFDDFYDNEGQPEALSLGLICLRELTLLFIQALPENQGFLAYFQTVLDRLDAANAWEVHNCRIQTSQKKLLLKGKVLPEFADLTHLADKSFGHALGPMSILFARGFSSDSKVVKSASAFFQHYLIARQLNDDAHDWEEDLRKGQLTLVNTRLLTNWQKTQRKEHNPQIKKLLLHLREEFWTTELPQICSLIEEHLTLAKQAIENLPTIKNPEVLLSFLKPIQQAVDEAREEQQKTLDFLSAYQKKTTA